MRRIVTACISAVCVAGAALAQDAPPALETSEAQQATPAQLRWIRQPDARAFAHNYPSRAVSRRIHGAAVMCCTILTDGRLDCTVPFAWPRDYGFDEATLRISREFRLDEESAARYAGGRIRRHVFWIMGSRSPELDAILTRIREGTQDICGPTIDRPERESEDAIVTGAPEGRPQ